MSRRLRRGLWAALLLLFAASCTDFFGRELFLMLESLPALPQSPEKSRPAVVLVLGGGAVAEGDLYQPSVSSQRRLRRALELFHALPDAAIMISGIEAPLMANWLRGHGFSGACLIEGQSLNTESNIRKSAALLNRLYPKEGLRPQILLVTDRFHMARTALWAKRYMADFDLYSLPAPSMVRRSCIRAVYFVPTSRGLGVTSLAWREVLALIRDYLKIQMARI
ncbi:MAG: YdcF family protein [Pyramidobacter sp.]